MSSSAISLPFSFNNFGELTYSTDPKKIWQDRVLLVLMTRFGERVMRPNYGSLVNQTVFENEALAVEKANRTITEAFSKWLPDLEVTAIRPVFDAEQGALEVSVFYRLPTGEEDTVKLKTAILSSSGDLIQEITNG
jgi:phage baseplate assembly protein W